MLLLLKLLLLLLFITVAVIIIFMSRSPITDQDTLMLHKPRTKECTQKNLKSFRSVVVLHNDFLCYVIIRAGQPTFCPGVLQLQKEYD